MMNVKGKKSFIEKLFYDNKFLMVFSVILAVAIWLSVKINYSDNTTRTVSNVKINISSSISDGTDYEAFVLNEDLYCEVEVRGKSYDINSAYLKSDDIVVDATGTYADSAGYKVLTLSAKTNVVGISGVEITKITPSTITVYYDRKMTDTFNVEPKLKNDLNTLTEGEYTVGQPVASMNTVDVTGPATILGRLKKVYFVSEIKEDKLPLTSSKDIKAKVNYDLENEKEGKYLHCEGITDENPATITLPVYVNAKVDTAVKFVNQPRAYSQDVPGVTIMPSTVKISYNTKGDEKQDSLYVGTIDFSNVSNTVNVFRFPVDESLGVSVSDKSIKEFVVRVNMSNMKSVSIDKAPGDIVILNKDDGFEYSAKLTEESLEKLTVIGPYSVVDKITADDLRVEINVSSLNKKAKGEQVLDVSNISIQNESFDNCWVYGKYKAVVTVEKK